MDYKKNDIIKSLEELTLIYNSNIDCSKNPKLCNFSILLSQTINKTIMFLESQNKTNTNTTNNTNTNKIPSLDTNINYIQLSQFNN